MSTSKIAKLRVMQIWIGLLIPAMIFSLLSTACTGQSSLSISTLPGYSVALFASGNASYQNPDSVVADQGHIFIGYQNFTRPDGTDHGSSTIVEYTLDGTVLKTFLVPGRCDGLRADPTTHLLWSVSNEDSNPQLAIINPRLSKEAVTLYTFPPAPHAGGYDDLYFLDGMVFVSASNPSLKDGINVYPVLDRMRLDGRNVALTPVLMGNATATDAITKAIITLNEIDPDSLSTDIQGDLVMINQAGSEIIIVSHPGTPQQEVSRIPLGTQVDDTVWATSSRGRLLVVDASRNQSFWLRTSFTRGTIYTETSDDSSVAGIVGQIDPGTGMLSIVATGFLKPTGLLFVPDSQS